MMIVPRFFAKLYHYFWKIIPLIFSLLTACSFNQQLKTEKTGLMVNPLWITHQQQLAKIINFQTSGVFAYISTESKIYAKFFYQQYMLSHYRLLLINPLGATELELSVTPGIIQLMDRTGKKYVNHQLVQMIYHLTGMEIQFDNVPYWLIGLPMNATSFTLDKNGLLKTIKYMKNGEVWHLNYLSYNRDSEPKLPSRIELTQGKRCIKLKIDNWIIKR